MIEIARNRDNWLQQEGLKIKKKKKWRYDLYLMLFTISTTDMDGFLRKFS